jgi:hypothetical protein
VREPFAAAVSGRGIARVAFSVDGRRRAVARRPAAPGRYRVRLDPRGLRPGRHRVRARVTFTGAAPRTLTRTVRVCARPAGRARFTG